MNDNLIEQLRAEGKARFGDPVSYGVHYMTNPEWPHINPGLLNQWFEKWGYEKVRDAIFLFLDPWEGNSEAAVVFTHDTGTAVNSYLEFGDASVLFGPAPPDTRYAAPDTQLQLSYLERGLNIYGQPLEGFHAVQGAQKWASFAGGAYSNAAFGVAPDTAKVLLMNNLIGSPSDKFAWTPFRGVDVAGAIVAIEKINHPGAKLWV